MKVALCLYGQPRHLQQGYQSIKKHILDVYKPDVFYHTWDSKDNYQVSPWRKNICTLPLKDIRDVEELYKPTRYAIEIPKTFDVDKTTPGFLMTPFYQHNNVNNVASQIHSRQIVRNLLENYVIETKTNYDLVIMTRFDINIESLPEPKKDKIYFTSDYPERPYFFNDNLFMSNYTAFLQVFDIEPNLTRYMTVGIMNPLDEGKLTFVHYNTEELIVGSLMDHDLLKICEKRSDMKISLL